MKQKETMSNTPLDNDDILDDHVASSYDTPLRPDAFEMDDELKKELIAKHFKEIMQILGMDLTDDSLAGTPRRVAKMYVEEVFSGLNPKNKPKARLFENKFGYNQMLVEKDITFYSHCEHHFVPIYGKAHVAYISSGEVIGLSKINRIVQYYSKRPQVQERLTVQIANELRKVLKTEDVGVVIDANHMCVSSRGVGDTNSKTGTAHFSGKFLEEKYKNEFLNYINSPGNGMV
ncbi:MULTISPECIES: GTP cyclohydrolase I FolE [Reichenbachiella]|uniref:GTP cyclohydrolase 1 n=2 Tax=Reichenbachiella TaxID=156993 RepID=A0A1M6TPI0_REIAG|nr:MULTISPECIES: GTP cyclohydrolase I FolE [Reichenbachiella]MBU2915519.1 GTP cyclohydrolase I FolE [Reichenbachiella agariperforans]RJE71416.1 GTP cyclohydrolase I FolE [Reichenbachiella sp. MSK19-1]SHK58823.1 GTP cyclohydrolase I [Reichenbachiella agariperforans]